MTSKPVKKTPVKKEEKKPESIQVETGNVEIIKIQFMQAINNQLGMIIELLKEIKDKK